jgi:hypothetical protein
MLTVHVQRPHVDPRSASAAAPARRSAPCKTSPAVYVTSVGETRSRTNVILLEARTTTAPEARDIAGARRFERAKRVLRHR